MSSFGDDIRRTLLEGRESALSVMFDECTLATVGPAVTDYTTGAVTNASAVVYAGPCQVSTYEPQEATPESAGATLTVQRYRFKIPVGSCSPAVGMVATVTASEFDPGLVGRKFRVVALLHKTAATAYRLSVEEVL